MIPGIVYSWSWTIPLDELEMYQFFAILSIYFYILSIYCNKMTSSLAKKKKQKMTSIKSKKKKSIIKIQN